MVSHSFSQNIVGDCDGLSETVGRRVVGKSVGRLVGTRVLVGDSVGWVVIVGLSVGFNVGLVVGSDVGGAVGTEVGRFDGVALG